MDADQAAARLGSVVDSWTIEQLIGVGGMAAVYAGRNGDDRRAIKILHLEVARSQRALDRFRREDEVLQMELHPGVPHVHARGTTADGAPYLVMDLLLGETIEARRRRFGGRLPWPEVVTIATVVLGVLEEAHARGVLHRDIKPSNVLWLDDGSVRVIDFGIAFAESAGDAPTRTGELPGSLPFMSPEHALGVPEEIDERSDLWSLGATMFLLLSGRPVHESATELGALALSASKPAPSLGTVARELPPALIGVVDRALAFDPKKRFASAAAMRAGLGSDQAPTTHRAWWRWPAVAVVALGAAAAWRLHGTEPMTEPPSITTATAPVVVPAPSTPPLLASAPPAPVRSPEPADAGRPASSARKPTPSAVAPPPSAHCDPPFVIDPVTGTRRVKPGC